MDSENARAVEAAYIASSGLDIWQCISWIDSYADRRGLPPEVVTRSIMRHYTTALCSDEEIMRRSDCWPAGYFDV